MSLRIPNKPPDSVPPPGNAPLLQPPKPLPSPDNSVPEWRKAGYLIQSLQDEIKMLRLDNTVTPDELGVIEDSVKNYRVAYLQAEVELQQMLKSASSLESIEVFKAREKSDSALINFYIAENKRLSYLVARVSQDLDYLRDVITDVSRRNINLKKDCTDSAEKRAPTSQSLTSPLVVDASWLEGVRRAVTRSQRVLGQ